MPAAGRLQVWFPSQDFIADARPGPHDDPIVLRRPTPLVLGRLFYGWPSLAATLLTVAT